MTWCWLKEGVILAVHDEQIAEHGGRQGIRDMGLVSSALMRPQHLAAYENPSVFDLAAAYAFGIIKNHPFVDGNKRIAFAAADVFLRINGWRLRRAPMQIYAEMMQMFESGTFDIAHLDPWLRSFAVAAE